MIKVAMMIGSFRRESINRKLARALIDLGESRFAFEPVRIDDLPFYNQDLEDSMPAEVLRMKEQIARCEGVLFVTPEYDRSIPGVLKNAIDWATRPRGKGAWQGRPGAVIGASNGNIGTAVAQQHLRTILASANVSVMPKPEVYFAFKEGLVDDQGRVTDETMRAILTDYLDSFEAWIRRLRA